MHGRPGALSAEVTGCVCALRSLGRRCRATPSRCPTPREVQQGMGVLQTEDRTHMREARQGALSSAPQEVRREMPKVASSTQKGNVEIPFPDLGDG